MAERYQIPGQAVTETVRTTDDGVDTIWDGLHRVVHDGTEYLADRSIVHDAGRLGKSFSFISHAETAPDLTNLERVLNQMGYRLVPKSERAADTA